MQLKGFLVAVAGMATFLSGAAQAQSSDAFTTFNGTQGAGNFYYADVKDANSITVYTATTNCFIDGSVCAQLLPNHDVPGVTKSTVASFQYGTVDVPTDRLLVHPGTTSALASLLYAASTPGTYKVTATFNVQDRYPTGVDIYLLGATAGTFPISMSQIGSLSAASPTFAYSSVVTLGFLDVVGFGIGNGGSYFNDSTGVNFTVTAVPEPASWAMLILGFAVIGGVMRRQMRLSDARFTAKVRALAAGKIA